MTIYNEPEEFGLTVVGDSDANGDYEFDMFVVWTDGKHLFWATDSGCSCPSPFEDFRAVSDLSTGSRDDCLRAIDAWGFSRYSDVAKECIALKEKVREWRAER